jgi:hypothetical protein
MTKEQQAAITKMRRISAGRSDYRSVPVGLPPEIAGKTPGICPPSRRCGKCGGIVGPAKPGERKCTCEQVACVMVDGTVVYLTRTELKLIISARPVDVPGTDLGWLDAERACSDANP